MDRPTKPIGRHALRLRWDEIITRLSYRFNFLAIRDLWPAVLGSLSLRRSRCIRENCPACLSGEQHQSYVLYGRAKRGRYAVYVPEELWPAGKRSLAHDRA